MTPTNRLRFVERDEEYIAKFYADRIVKARRRVPVLQQWWHENDEPPPSSRGEWRDVELEQE
jgi:hypothetical protein